MPAASTPEAAHLAEPPFPGAPTVTWEVVERFTAYQRAKLESMGITPPEPLTDPAEEYAHLLMLGSLDAVGPEKPISYLPFSALVGICDKDVNETQRELEEKGLATFVSDAGEGITVSGALYAYDKDALQELLDQHTRTLEDAMWPRDAASFSKRVSTEFVRDGELYTLIAWAFADPRPEYQRPA